MTNVQESSMIKDKGEAIGNQTGIESRQREFESASAEAGIDTRRVPTNKQRYINDFQSTQEARGERWLPEDQARIEKLWDENIYYYWISFFIRSN